MREWVFCDEHNGIVCVRVGRLVLTLCIKERERERERVRGRLIFGGKVADVFEIKKLKLLFPNSLPALSFFTNVVYAKNRFASSLFLFSLSLTFYTSISSLRFSPSLLLSLSLSLSSSLLVKSTH